MTNGHALNCVNERSSLVRRLAAESIEWFMDARAFLRHMIRLHAHSLLPPCSSGSCVSFSVFLCVIGRSYLRERGGSGWARNPRESLALYKSFNTLICGSSLVYLQTGTEREEFWWLVHPANHHHRVGWPVQVDTIKYVKSTKKSRETASLTLTIMSSFCNRDRDLALAYTIHSGAHSIYRVTWFLNLLSLFLSVFGCLLVWNYSHCVQLRQLLDKADWQHTDPCFFTISPVPRVRATGGRRLRSYSWLVETMSPKMQTFMVPRNRFQGIDSASPM